MQENRNIQYKSYQLYLKNLSLRNFRGFTQLENLEFHERLTVFIGTNGSGKSSILDAIAEHLKFVLHQLILNQNQADFESGLLHRDIKNGTGALEVDSELALYETAEVIRLDEETGQEDTEGAKEELQAINKIRLTSKLGGSPEPTKTKLENSHKQIVNKLNSRQASDNLPVLAYYGGSLINTNVVPPKKTKQGEKNPIPDNLQAIYDNALEPERFSFGDFHHWFDDLYRMYLQVAEAFLEDTKKFEDIGVAFYHDKYVYSTCSDMFLVREALEQVFSEEGSTEPYFKNLKMVYGIKSEPRVAMTKGQDIIYANQLSSGEKNIFALVADLTRRLITANPSLKNPLEGQGIVLIDEVELHLHPKWQRMVIPKLREVFPNIQFIVTTHSRDALTLTHAKYVRELNNYQCYSLEDETFGADIEYISKVVMDVPANPFTEQLDKIDLLIGAEKREEALEVFDEIVKEVKKYNPESSNLSDLVIPNKGLFTIYKALKRRGWL